MVEITSICEEQNGKSLSENVEILKRIVALRKEIQKLLNRKEGK